MKWPRTPLRWAGSKRLLLSRLKEFWPGGRTRYVEPFAGSASLFFEINPRRALLGDLNGELVGCLSAIKSDVEAVVHAVGRLPMGKEAYYKVRAVDPRKLSSIQLAARFLYLNHYCFNGIYRTNLSGQFNVPYGPPKSGAPVDLPLLRAAAGYLQRATIVQGDFERTLARVRPGDFVYLDPPYVVNARRVFAEYCPESFTVADLDRLGEELLRLNRLGAIFVVSYADSAEGRKLLRPWRPERVRVRRNIAGFAAVRRSSYELLATNAPAK